MTIITGMHRSGTSLVAQLLYRVGLDFGDPTHFVPADRWNPGGYIEQQGFRRLNDAIILGPWGRVHYLWLPSPSLLERRARSLASDLAIAARRAVRWVVKDCRFCLTLPIWKRHVPVERIVFCLRHPQDVAASLARRNRIPLRLGLTLWHHHVSRFLDALADTPCLTVDYDALMTGDQAAQIARLHHFLGLTPDPRLESVVPAVVRPGWHHHRAAVDLRAIPLPIRELYQRAQALLPPGLS